MLRTVAGTLGLTLLAALVYALSLIATMPATALRDLVTLPSQIGPLYGSVWNGRADLDHGYALTWEVRPTSILTARIGADVRIEGGDTLLTGALAVGLRSVALTDISGRAGPGLLRLAPDILVTSCDARAVVDGVSLRTARGTAGADGTVTVDAGTCAQPSGNVLPVPALRMTLATVGPDARAVVTGVEDDAPFASLMVAGAGRLVVRMEPEAAALVTGVPQGGPVELDYPLDLPF